MSTQLVRRLTPAEYLEIERRSETKHEFYRGEMFAMAGATREHALIAAACVGTVLRFSRRRAATVMGLRP